MALRQSDILVHNNPNLAVADSDFIKGGFRSEVINKTDLYLLIDKIDEPSASGQLKEHSTIVYVSSESKYYVLVDVNNVGNQNGWKEFIVEGGGVAGLTGSTNGLSDNGTIVKLGGDLTETTTITITSGSSFFITDNRNDSRGIKYSADYSTYYTDRSLVDKGYVDTVATGLQPKSSVLVATTGNTTLSGLQTIDGVSLVVGNRVLVKDQTNDVDNGIYIVASGVWQRSSDFDGAPQGEIIQGALIPVVSGDTNINTLWILITSDPIIVGITELEFSLFSQPINIINGDGITTSTVGGQTTIAVDLVNTNSGLEFIGGELQITNIGGSGTTWTNGQLDANVSAVAIAGTAIPVKLDGSGDLAVDGNDINLNIPITGASNGLCVSGKNIVLGGTLTGNTSIYGGDVNSLNITNISNGWISAVNSVALSTYDSVIDTNLCVTSNYVRVSSYDYGASSPNTSFRGVIYGDNYHNSYLDRSLVDKEYVDDQVSGSTLTYNNGLIKSGQVVSLGGTLTGNTCIGTNDSYGFAIGCEVQATGKNSFAIGCGVQARGNNSFAIGYGGYYNNLIAQGNNSFIVGSSSYEPHCVIGDNSAILGGYSSLVTSTNSVVIGGCYNHNCSNAGVIIGGIGNRLRENNHCSVIIGGENIDILNGCLPNHAIVPNLAIWDTPTTGSITDEVLVWNSTDKKVKRIGSSSLGEDNNKYNLTVVTTSITLPTSGHTILVNHSGAITLTLTNKPFDGQIYIIKDVSGDAYTNLITIAGNGNNIDGSANATINTDYGALEIVYSNTLSEWYTLAFIS